MESDEVDEIVQAWQRQRPDLDPDPLQLLSRISRIAQLLNERAEQAFAEHSLARHEFDVLAALRRAGAPFELTAGQLLAATHVTSGTMTNRIDRLTQRRLVIRRDNPADGRQSLIRLSATGRRRVDAAFESLLAAEHVLIARLSGKQREQATIALRHLLQAASG